MTERFDDQRFARTLESMAQEMGITCERVRQIQLKALVKLRRLNQLRDFIEDAPVEPAVFGVAGKERDGCVWRRPRPRCP
jgi:hypothetical protein